MATVSAPPGASTVQFRGLGGPFRKGLIAVSGSEGSSPLRVIARYDLDRSENIAVPRPGEPASRLDLAEAAGIEPWDDPPTAEQRLFYAAMSPIALFWRELADVRSFRSTLSGLLPALYKPGELGTARGFAPHPFLPVLVESRSDGAWLTWTNDASEFELAGLHSGPYRVRALDLFGRVTYARGQYVAPGAINKEAVYLGAKLELDEPESREVMGFVRWESGVPVKKAVVIMQDTTNFRRFLRRVESDENGFFRIAGVPGNESYFAFTVPPGDRNAMRNFEYFHVLFSQREVWRELTLHPHRASGNVPNSTLGSVLQLISIDSKAEQSLFAFHADPSGRFELTNVPHGRYRLEIFPYSRGGERVRSSPFDVVDGQAQVPVSWPEP